MTTTPPSPIAKRRKDYDWSMAPDTYEAGHLRLLMDIRDELKLLNTILQCRNFLAIPQTLSDIKKNTKRPPRKAPKRPQEGQQP